MRDLQEISPALTALALRQEGIRIRLPHPRPCMAAQCQVPAAGHVIWLSSDWSTVNAREVCGGHVEALRNLGRCLLFPLDRAPSQERLMAAINAEIQRRSVVRQQQVWQSAFGNYSGGMTNMIFTFTASS